MPTINEENIVSEEEMTSTEEKESSEEELEGYSTPDRAVSEMVDRQNLEVEEITTEDVDEGIPESNLRRSKRTIKKPQYLKDYETNFLTTSVEPLTIEEALTSDAKENWKDAMKTEMDTLNENNTWTIVDDVPDENKVNKAATTELTRPLCGPRACVIRTGFSCAPDRASGPAPPPPSKPDHHRDDISDPAPPPASPPAPRRAFTVTHQNAQSLNNKTKRLEALLLQDLQCDVLAIRKYLLGGDVKMQQRFLYVSE
ncbi:hypothetical protein JYU34_016021 [Plutella xylostella]|uniref:Uncharacterized protein n=1 Tax=Plutella xylostella TaxID=51655 RepID=A0ABQ7Q593_PLUXY|nr:hypothetical protein JYU34_016021 [Plutella xylostella]